MRKQRILVGGGTRSGKSDFALALARSLGSRRLFVATALPCDDEMRDRIRRHQFARGDGFQTMEEPTAIVELLRKVEGHDVVIVDCLTIWLANLLLQGDEAGVVLRQVDDLAAVLTSRKTHTVMVTSEVGLGLVPETPLGRLFRDISGSAHQRLAALADEVYFGVMGVMLRLKPGPVTLASGEEWDRRERRGRGEMQGGASP